MVEIGYRPILWHVMKYYAHYGHKDFILCLGYKADAIKNYFLRYNEAISNDFVLSNGGKELQLLGSDIHDWTITFADTGIYSNIGQRLKAVEKYLEREDIFLANYVDGLTGLHLPTLIDFSLTQNKVATFISVKPTQSFHIVSTTQEGAVLGIQHAAESGVRMNGGYFVFRKAIFKYIQDGEELVKEPFQRLIEREQLMAYNYDGFWACMDTFKEKQQLDDLHAKGDAPWEVWKRSECVPTRTAMDKEQTMQ